MNENISWKENFYNVNVSPYEKYEMEACERIKRKFNVELISFNKTNKFDFVTSDNISYEVKADLKSVKTNNFFIEFKGYYKPSGIKTSQASFYIITNGTNYYLIEINALKELCNSKHAKIRNTKDKLTYGFIINKNIIISRSIEI